MHAEVLIEVVPIQDFCWGFLTEKITNLARDFSQVRCAIINYLLRFDLEIVAFCSRLVEMKLEQI